MHPNMLMDMGSYPRGASASITSALPSGPAITTVALDDAIDGQAYSFQLTGTGTAALVWAHTAGTLPSGITFDPTTHTLSGTHTGTAGPVSLTFTLTDPWKRTTSAVLALTVAFASVTFTDKFTYPDADPFANANWIVEPGSGGTIQMASNKLKFSNGVNASTPFLGRIFYSATRIPGTWASIDITCDVEFAGAVFCDFGIGLCMDDPATGDFCPTAGSMQNGYGTRFARGGFEEGCTRFHGGAKTALNFADVSDLLAGPKTCRVTFTKLSDRITITAYYDGVQLWTVDDTNAARKTGACYVGLGTYSPAANFVYLTNFVATYT